MSATAERGGLSLIAVVLGCTTTQERFASAAQLLDYGFANWSCTEMKLPKLSPIPVTNGMIAQTAVQTQAGSTVTVLVPKGKEEQVETRVSVPENVRAPVEKGQTLGKIEFVLEDETLASATITAKESVEEITWQKCFLVLLQALCSFHAELTHSGG